MAPNEQAAAKRGRGRPRREASEPQAADRMSRGIKVMAAFRIPQHLHSAMTAEARGVGADLTAFVNRLFDAYLNYFGLPRMVRERLEEDRHALELSRHEYFQYLLFRRYEAVSKEGPAFDRPVGKGK